MLELDHYGKTDKRGRGDQQMNQDCVFCRIASGQAPADILYQDDHVTAFWDNRPAAPLHILVIPKRHIDSMEQVSAEDVDTLGRMLVCASQLAAQYEAAQSGYRLVINVGPEGGQTVYHLHVHLIAGRRLPVFHG
jgi:histidine triad (HIT) family protein